MKKTISILVATVLSLYVSSAFARTVTTNVYCGKVDGSDWYWLLDKSGNRETISGRWHADPRWMFTETIVLSIYSDEYAVVQNKCRVGYYAHAGSSALSPWHRFKVTILGSSSDDFFYAPGRESLLLSLTNLSDSRLKENIQQLESNLDKVARLNGYKYPRISYRTNRY
jgi:hypothetical protein